ncbi:uncharacterized protein LOC121423073 [Lytechinus variegatus]|uniref:uncharacterized protein LOC121423073 n=1 Tax=Lytechinus variegatus TaxID=7654 RepID=UPI001BB14545|nr:uncharacterized protein LOC121423073 [Lytechinus variegatus]
MELPINMRFDDRFLSRFAGEIFIVFILFSGAISQNIGDVRLVNASGVVGGSEGRVEVFTDHGRRTASWARLCSSGWGADIASVVCRQLGFQDSQRYYRNGAPFGQGSRNHIVRLDRCLSGTEATTINELQCVYRGGGGIICTALPDAGVKCVEQPVTSLPPIEMKHPSPAVETTPNRESTSRTRRRTTTSTTEPSTTSQMTSTVSTPTTSTTEVTSSAPDFDFVTSDFMTTDDYVTLDSLPLGLNTGAIYIGVPTFCFIIVLIVIIIILRHRCKGKVRNAKPTGRINGRGSHDREINFPDNKYQYNAVSHVDSTAPRTSYLTGEEYLHLPIGLSGNAEGPASDVPKQDSMDEYQYSAIGPIQNGADHANPRVPTQDSIDEYQYSAVGPIQNGAGNEPRLPNQDSLDAYQYSAVGPLENGADTSSRIPKQDSIDEYQNVMVGPIENGADAGPRIPKQGDCEDNVYAPVGASSSATLTPASTALASVCTDEGLYIIPNTSAINPYQELTVKTTTFAGLQKLKKKPVLEQNTQQSPEVKIQKKPALVQNTQQTPEVKMVKAAKKSPGTPKKPVRKPQASTADDLSAKTSRVPHQQMEISNAVYGPEVIGEQTPYAVSFLVDGQRNDRGESIYANDIEMWEIPSSEPDLDDQTDNGGFNVGENPYENSMIGDQSFLQDSDDSSYQALSRKATLPV